MLSICWHVLCGIEQHTRKELRALANLGIGNLWNQDHTAVHVLVPRMESAVNVLQKSTMLSVTQDDPRLYLMF